MKRYPILLALGILVALSASPVAAAKRFVTLDDMSWPPYFFGDDASQPPGFARELLTQCIEGSTKFETRYSPLSVDAMYQALKSGALDAHVMSYKKDREMMVMYGRVPLFFDNYRPFVLASNPVQVKSLADLDNLKLGGLKGLQYSDEYREYFQKRLQAGTAQLADSDQQLIQMLLSGQIDAFVNLESTARWVAWNQHVLDRIRAIPYDVQVGDYYLVVSQSSNHVDDKRAFLDKIDQCILAKQKDGTYQQLRTKYGLE